jgi:prevent-host-death family protein
MKTATVRELRNEFSKLEAWMQEGEQIEIVKRGKPVARLVPAGKPRRRKLVKPDFMAQLEEIWGDRVFSAEEVRAMREAELEGEEG